jgi:ribosomal protein L37E
MAMEELDGNAIAGQLVEVFGRDMTRARGACAHCGTESQLAELAVYTGGPGTVVRCRACGNVAFVFVTVRQTTCIDVAGFALDVIS